MKADETQPPQSGATRRAFLVYDSRSGSTLLASVLNQLAGVSVSHESRFISEVMEYPGNLDDPDCPARLTRHLFIEVQFSELGWSRDEVEAVIAAVPVPRSRAGIILALTDVYFSTRDPAARWRVIKSGGTLFHAEALRRLFPDTRLIHVVRDARAVYVSKCSTIGTPGYVMENNPAHAALDWREVNRIVARHADISITVRFEDLVCDPEATLERLADALELSAAERALTKTTEGFAVGIGESQRHLHRRVGSRPEAARIDAWRDRIAQIDARVIDLMAGPELVAFGYELLDAQPPSAVGRLHVRLHWLWSYLRFVPRYLYKAWFFAFRQRSLRHRIRKKLYRTGWLRSSVGNDAVRSPVDETMVGAGSAVGLSGPAALLDSIAPAPRVSVIIPTFDRRQFVLRAIESVLSQTLHDIEVIVVDDGSADDTAALVGALSDPRIRLLRHEHTRGACAARNTGIDAARAEWMAFLDDDDRWLPQKLERQLASIGTADAVLVGYRTMDAGRVRLARCKQIGIRDLFKGNPFSGSGFLVRADASRAVRFDETLPRSQDWDFLLRLVQRGTILYVPEVLFEVDNGTHARITTASHGRSLDELERRAVATTKHAAALGPYWTKYRMSRQLLAYVRQQHEPLRRVLEVARRWGVLPTLHVLFDKATGRDW